MAGPWIGDSIPSDQRVSHHLSAVLRLLDGARISYTDGSGTVGEGVWRGPDVIRGDERSVSIPTPLVTIAVAPPQRTERCRFIVEKLAELGVAKLLWLETRRGEGRMPRMEKAVAWAVGALEQSKGTHLLEVGGTVAMASEELRGGLTLVADQAGTPFVRMRQEIAHAPAITVLVGPEGGFADGEASSQFPRVSVAERILRVETAALTSAALIRAFSVESER